MTLDFRRDKSGAPRATVKIAHTVDARTITVMIAFKITRAAIEDKADVEAYAQSLTRPAVEKTLREQLRAMGRDGNGWQDGWEDTLLEEVAERVWSLAKATAARLWPALRTPEGALTSW